MASPTPSVLGPYAIEHALDHGGTSTVLLGRHRWLDRVVAIKLRTRGEGEDEAVLNERFRLGAILQAELTHPCIAQVFDYLEISTHQALVMEFLGGGTIEDRLRAGNFGMGAALSVAIGAGHALEYAHQRGVVHRDIKPANLLLADRDRPSTVRVNDFGVARSEHLSRDLTQPGAHVGTLWYMPPEQFDGGLVGPSGDLYSLAATTYEMLTNSLPFDRVETAEIFRRFLDRVPPPPIRGRNPAVPPALAALVEQGLSLEADLRGPGTGLFALGLRALAERAGILLDDGGDRGLLEGEGPQQLVGALQVHDEHASRSLAEALDGLHRRLRGAPDLSFGGVSGAETGSHSVTHEMALTSSMVVGPGGLLEQMVAVERTDGLGLFNDDEDDDDDHTLVMRLITDD